MRYQDLHDEMTGGTARGSLPGWAGEVLEAIGSGASPVVGVGRGRPGRSDLSLGPPGLGAPFDCAPLSGDGHDFVASRAGLQEDLLEAVRR
ncbi:hypothetical protein SAMN05216275_106178 [Streptosporangium canum]|uniref:Uncharacterized protein n=1 Tax=Streptosporangium canum TaxID=324952 RepID=A0A1I3NCF8_9ACTN|nr:hypothetical protein [Streptosporangium canum]SFJ06747.1 hypothetical protein SAMN05216275_106178 [Streptosporangium canum]